VIDPGHTFALARLDGPGEEALRFVKRIGEHYPGNAAPAYPGTTLQEVMRAIISRAEYVNRQIPCAETDAAIGLLRAALLLFEIRAQRVKGKMLDVEQLASVVDGAICNACGHINCRENHAVGP
jgi:hypothetical protein